MGSHTASYIQHIDIVHCIRTHTDEGCLCTTLLNIQTMKAVEARQGSLWQLLALIILFSVYIKYSVGLWGYSGFNTPPMHGDFEAQRHWMEVTTNLPLAEWYSFDLMYWGLDYPPLTAYVSCFFGWLARGVRLPELVALHASRGIETEHTKIFMRVSVIICDLVVFTPSVVLLAPLLQPELAAASPLAHSIFVLAGLLSPGLLLIDHGHFQYNCVAIGLTLLGARCILRDRDILGRYPSSHSENLLTDRVVACSSVWRSTSNRPHSTTRPCSSACCSENASQSLLSPHPQGICSS